MGKSGSAEKSFAIPKLLVWEAYERVRANKGAAGVDGQSLAAFESDLRNNLYKIWNRMSSGTYFPPPIKAVEIPKPNGGGTRVLGVPTVADRVAQTVAALTLEPRTESIFHDDSYGYRPNRSAHDALAKCRQRCWQKDWVIDLDVAKFFDSVDHDLMVKAVAANITTEQRWVLLYVKRWLTAPMQMPDGSLRQRDRGTPQGSAVSPVLAINPIVAGWMNYYGRFHRSQLYPLLQRVNTYLMRWAGRKYKRLHSYRRFTAWWSGVVDRDPGLFTHWRWVRTFAGFR